MCDIDAFIMANGIEEKVLENVERVEMQGDQMKLSNIFGEQKMLKARFTYYDNSDKRMIFEPL